MPQQQDSTTDAHAGIGSLTLEQLFAEFCRVADQLQMPAAERAGILGVGLETWPVWSPFSQLPERHAEYLRRLQYALPLMRRSLSNQG